MSISAGLRGGIAAEPNVVPLIDVLLVLIIIFMVINPPNPRGLWALVPQPATVPEPANPDTIVVQVTAAGEVKVNQTKSSWDQLGPELRRIFEKRADKAAFIQGDDAADFAVVAKAIAAMRGAGIERIGMMGAQAP